MAETGIANNPSSTHKITHPLAIAEACARNTLRMAACMRGDNPVQRVTQFSKSLRQVRPRRQEGIHCGGNPSRPVERLCQDLADDVAVDVGQAAVDAIVAEGE